MLGRDQTQRAEPVATALDLFHAELLSLRAGAVADYIPELAKADPDSFGLALVSMDGHRYAAGDADMPFTIQSISKPFVYALALGDLGEDEVLARVGVEPSGEAFNAIRLEPPTGRPPNPMVNAGALLTTSLVRADDPEARFARILSFLSALAGHQLEIDEAVYASELSTANRNRALAYLMRSLGSLDEDVEKTIDVYCRQCAVSVTTVDLAVMAATLGNGGVNPVTGANVLEEGVAVRALSVMATCGMYDFSGEWLMRVGLPAKSGVAGGLIATGPAEFGIGVFSPRLEQHGNSVRGVAAVRELAKRFELHLMHNPGPTAPVVYFAAREPASDGRRIEVIAAQGDLEFAAAERLLWSIANAIDEPAAGTMYLLLDAHRVTRVHHVAERMLVTRLGEMEEHGISVALVEPDGIDVSLPADARFSTREEALRWCRSEAPISRADSPPAETSRASAS
jgi:glutaminase